MRDDSIIVELGDGATWEPEHTWVNGRTTQVDGAIWFRGERTAMLDVVALGDGCCTTRLCLRSAESEWAAGRVHTHIGHCGSCGVTAVVVHDEFINDEMVREAVIRYVGAGMPREGLPVCNPSGTPCAAGCGQT